MSLLQSLLLGIIQGITEFLPISSSGHLVLTEATFGLNMETLKSFDVALHVGSLTAILIYFRKTIVEILTKEHRYIWYLFIGTIPTVIIGFTLQDQIDQIFRSVLAVGIMMILTGAYFLIAEKIKTKNHPPFAIRYLLIGLSQAVAIIPGISRSGSTIATGLLTGMERIKAAEYSFLLGSIAITGAGILTAKDMGSLEIGFAPLAIGFFASAITSYFAVKFLMQFFKKHTLKPFACYLFAIGVLAIIVWFDIQSPSFDFA